MDLQNTSGEKQTFSRGGHQKEIFVPRSCDSMVVVQSNIKGTGFMRNTWWTNRPYIGGTLKMKEFNGIIDTCSQIVGKVYSHNRKKDVEGINQYVLLSLGLSTALLFCFFFLMYYGIRDDNENARIAGFFILAISVFITLVIGIVNFFQKPEKYTSYKDMVRKTLNAFFERLNKKYGNRGLEFEVKENHYWIQVNINKKKAETWRKQINYNPNQYDSGEEEDIKKRNNESREAADKIENLQTDGALYTAARDDGESHRFMVGAGSKKDQFEKDEDNVSELLKKIK